MDTKVQTITLSALTIADTVDFDALPESTRIELQRRLAAMIDRDVALMLGAPSEPLACPWYPPAKPFDCGCRGFVHTCNFVC